MVRRVYYAVAFMHCCCALDAFMFIITGTLQVRVLSVRQKLLGPFFVPSPSLRGDVDAARADCEILENFWKRVDVRCGCGEQRVSQ